MFCSTHPPLATTDARDGGVRTDGQGVVETHHRFTRLVLHPDQLRVLNNPPDKLALVGPPGDGTNIVYILSLLKIFFLLKINNNCNVFILFEQESNFASY